jgi:high affinity Mn2+ porin
LENASFCWNEELAGGEGLSTTRGVAGFPNGETFRIGNPAPAIYLARFFFQQVFPLKNSKYVEVEDALNQIKGFLPSSRITITAGKFSMDDFFDGNRFSHDPRTQFMNWSLMSNGAWDYPANTRGYTTGAVAEFIKPLWAFRISAVVEPKEANGLVMDYNVAKSHALTFEIQKSWNGRNPGMVRLLAFNNSSQAPNYQTTLQQVKVGDSSSLAVYTGEKEWKIYGGKKYGLGINLDQQLSANTGLFLKASWNDGRTAAWAFTEIDRSVSAGISVAGTKWKRLNDVLGIAEVANGISKDHRDFLNAGFYGFIIGDGKLNYGIEAITEIYYSAKVTKTLYVSADYQFIVNPAYNKARGPVHVFALRAHVIF